MAVTGNPNFKLGERWRRTCTWIGGNVSVYEGVVTKIPWGGTSRKVQLGDKDTFIDPRNDEITETVWERVAEAPRPRPDRAEWLPDPETGHSRWQVKLSSGSDYWTDVYGFCPSGSPLGTGPGYVIFLRAEDNLVFALDINDADIRPHPTYVWPEDSVVNQYLIYAGIGVWFLFLFAVAALILAGFFATWIESDIDSLPVKLAATAGLILATFVLLAVGAWSFDQVGGSSGPDGVHEWRGGSGAQTVCYYEDRSEYNAATKTYYDVTYTVCRDPGGR